MNNIQFTPIISNAASNNNKNKKQSSDKNKKEIKIIDIDENTEAAVFSLGSSSEKEDVDYKRNIKSELNNLIDLVEKSNSSLMMDIKNIIDSTPKTSTIPSVLGLTLDATILKLKLAKVKLGPVMEQFSSSVPKGEVIAQVPGPGSSTTANFSVALIVSKGQAN